MTTRRTLIATRATIYRFGDYELDADTGELCRDGRAVPLEPRVFDLLHYFVSNPNRVLTKDEINRDIWQGRIVSDSALSSCVKSVRQAIADDGKSQTMLKTVYGRGFRFVGDVEMDAKSVPSANVPHEKPIIAVAPFANLGGDPGEDHFADGMAADIIAALSRHRWLTLVARNTMAQFKLGDSTIEAIAAVTGADYIVEGSVRKVGERVRVNVELVDATRSACLWSESFDRQSEDIFDVLDTIALMIAARLEPAIGVQERRKVSGVAGSRDLKAWEAYHLGIAHFFRFTEEDNLRAQVLLNRAREVDPEFGEAHAWWAYAVVLGTVYWDVEPTTHLLDAALEATQQALEIDSDNSTFYALKARVQLARQEYASAIEGNRLAIELNPTFAAAHCGLADSLTYLGRYDEAIAQFEQAIELSSNDPQRWAFFTYGALACIFMGEYKRAIEWCDCAAEIPNHQYWTYAHKAVAAALMGLEGLASASLKQALAMEPRLSATFARQKLYFLQDMSQVERYVEGLVAAGALSF